MGQMAVQTQNIKQRSIDETDLHILNLLQEDCRLSFNKVAAKTKISVGTAYNRTKSLEAKGYVKGYTVLLDSTKMGCSLTAVIFVQVEGEHLSEVELEIARQTNVMAVYDVTGEFDAAVIAKFKDREDLSSFIKHIAALVHVKRTTTNVSLETVKEDFRIVLR